MMPGKSVDSANASVQQSRPTKVRLGQVSTTAAAAAGSQAKLNSGSRPGASPPIAIAVSTVTRPLAKTAATFVSGPRHRRSTAPSAATAPPTSPSNGPEAAPSDLSANHRSSIFCASVSQGLMGTRGADAPATTVTSLRPQALSIVLTRPAPASGVSHAPEVVDTTAKRRSVAASALRATRSSNPASVSTHKGRFAVMLLVTAIVRLRRSLRIHLYCQEQSQSITRLRRRSPLIRWSTHL